MMTDRWRVMLAIWAGIFLAIQPAAFCRDNVYFATGYKIGEVTQHSVVIWTRLTAEPDRNWQGIVANPHESPTRVMTEIPDIPVHLWEGSARGRSGLVRVLISTSPILQNARATAWEKVLPETDFTRQFTLDGLDPDARYYLCVEGRAADNGPVTRSAIGSFCTPPDEKTIKNVWFAVSSCQMYYHRDHREGFRIYESMRRVYKSLPDFMVRAGDSVYYDRDNPRGKTVDLCRLHWQRHYSLPLLREFHFQVPTYWMKDDHDTFFDDCWRTYEAPWIAPLTFEEGESLFEEQTPSPQGGRRFRTVRWESSCRSGCSRADRIDLPMTCQTDRTKRSGDPSKKPGCSAH